MSQSAYIKFKEKSTVTSITLDEVKAQLLTYKEQVNKTGQQLGWDYGEAAFPYTIETKTDAEGNWFYLKGINHLYKYIIVGVKNLTQDDDEQTYIQVVLPDGCTHGDKAKGNELCKYLGKQFKAELQLFNGRKMYFNPRK
ncbi:DUF1885 family protein [Chengkuizengella sp. SCS-71B]|uniref:DUF1885 family protein n=1 Tax=Chengkuizengella sp. SCS-71B TaxID=3115290 RepID=UPI0032C2477B